jgi:hypothetical protein
MRRLIGRRAIIVAMAGGLLATPLGALAQRAGTRPRVGLLLTGSSTDKAQTRELDAFFKQLGELG